ncbi:MAG: AMP-binding enzyme family protein, partial [Enterovirga sp.]|nr:AMP-binding enzyme family protein [Enterovirga sp.]
MAAEEGPYLDRLKSLWSAAWPSGMPREPRYPHGEITLTEYLRVWAGLQPEKPAYIFYGREMSYRELDGLSDRFAAMLKSLGIGKGDPVAVFLPNCPQFAIAFFGILKLGAVHVPVNPLFREAELAYELNDTGATVILALDSLMPLVRAVQGGTKLRSVLVTAFADMLPAAPTLPLPEQLTKLRIPCPDATDLLPALLALPQPSALPPADLDAAAALNYTGGTTGMPKGCVHTQRDMIYTAGTSLATSFALSPDDVVLCFVPVFWIAGEDLALILPIVAGCPTVLLARWDPAAVLKAVECYRVSCAYLLVDNAVELLEHPSAGGFDLTSLDKVRVSSFVKKLNPDVRARWRALTGSTLIEAAWGMTETHTMDTFSVGFQEGDYDLHSEPVFVGLPMPGTEFKICDFDTGALRPLGQEGELCVRTPSLLKGYWNKPDESAAALRDGWLHTGDIGRIDEEGFVHFLGRRKEMLKVRGMSVFPAEIEALLGQHPAVLGSGVIGRPDPDKGQVPVAFVHVRPIDGTAPGRDEMAAWCRTRMAAYKVPEIRIVDGLP